MMSRTFAVYVCSGVLLLAFLDQCVAIKCYKCHVTPTIYLDKNKSTPLCKNFERTEEFVIDCPFSTMCMKKILLLELQNGEKIETVMRGCADQKYTNQIFQNGAWRQVNEIEEPYEEACKESNEDSHSATSMTYCYCRGHLCNSAPSKESNGLHTDAMAVIFVFNAMKYLRIGTTR